MKAIHNKDTNMTFLVQEDLTLMANELKAARVKIGVSSLRSLLSGERDVVGGYTLIEMEPTKGADNAGGDNGGQQDQGQDNQPQNRRADDDQGDQGQGDNQGGDDQGDNGAGGTTNRVPGHGAQGFASMDADKQREIASEGGKHSHDNDGHPENRQPDPIPGNQGGTHEQHVNAGSQSHKNTNGQDTNGQDNGDQGNQSGQANNDGQESGGQAPNNQGGDQGGEDHPMRRADDHPMRRADDQNDDDRPQAAGGQQAAPAPVAPKPAANNNGGATRKAFKSVTPKGKIKPVRAGTKIAKGLELLLKGTNQKELEETDGGVSDDVYDFVNRRVTKRGYGIEVNGDQVKLVLPEGTTKIMYSNAAEGTAEEQAPADKPMDEVKGELDEGQPQDGDQAQAEPADADQQ